MLRIENNAENRSSLLILQNLLAEWQSCHNLQIKILDGGITIPPYN